MEARLPSGPHDPVVRTPDRAPHSVRRTSSVDMLRPEGLAGPLLLHGRARDVGTDAAGSGRVLAGAEIRATVAPDRQLAALDVDPAADAAQGLLGARVGGGFRARVDELLPEHRSASSPLYLLLDELPVATLISGYVDLYTGRVGNADANSYTRSDLCSGWRDDGTMMVSIRTTGRIPVPEGPEAPTLESPDDPLSWHEMDPMPVDGMRRRRRLDVIDDGPLLTVDAMFRDSHLRPDGMEGVLHEYAVRGAVDRDELRFTALAATPHVLPWLECPAAADSATRLVGEQVADVRSLVRETFTGTTTCTHLNDLLRALGDIGALAAILAAA